MPKVHLIHWQKEERQRYADCLEKAGYDVDVSLPESLQFFKLLRANPPDVMVIDLTRLPSQGRDIAINLRSQKASVNIPFVFIEGDPQKTAAIQKIVPDALYVHWESIEDALKLALQSPPQARKQDSVFAAYAATPLLKKLTIKPNLQIHIIHAPSGFMDLLAPLPENVTLQQEINNSCQLIIWFVTQAQELESSLPEIAEICEGTGARVWICWQKNARAADCAVTQNIVRAKGLAAGLVDYKICSIDSTWSGLLFRNRGCAGFPLRQSA
jgi:CheY-like chemotaxis protein